MKKSHDTLAYRLSVILTKFNGGESFTAKVLDTVYKDSFTDLSARKIEKSA